MTQQLMRAVALAIFAVLSSASFLQDQQPATQASKNLVSLPLGFWGAKEDDPQEDDPQEVPSDSATSVLETVNQAFNAQLHKKKGQWINNLLALAFGLVLLIDGNFTFKWVLLGGAFVVAVLFAQNEAAAKWGSDSEKMLRHVVGFEVGACVTYVGYHGYEGLLLGLSAALGAFVAFSVDNRSELGGHTFLQKPWVAFAWYSLCVLGCMYVVHTKKHVKAMGLVTSVMGGALVASALSYSITHAAVKGWLHVGQPVGGAWVDFLYLLVIPGSKDVGLFTDSGNLGETWPMDRVGGCLLWAILTVGGFVVQSKVTAARHAVAKARELSTQDDLNQLLLAGQ